MDLFTNAICRQLIENGRSRRDNCAPVVKLFTPDANATWLLSEVDPDDDDRLFGLCDLGLGQPELGYVSFSELKKLRGPLGLPVERDRHFSPTKTLIEYADEATAKGSVAA